MHGFRRLFRRSAPRFTLLALLALVLASCAQAPAPSSIPVTQAVPPRPAAPPAPGQAGQSSPEQASVERMIVRNIALTLVVADVDAVLAEISMMATELGGFVVAADSSESEGRRAGRASFRVPSVRLDEAVSRIKGLAVEVRRETNAAKDVTEEYVDQDARLRNLRATESQYLQVLNSAKTVEEIMTVRKALSEVRDQIERTEGRLQFLRNQTEMATVSVELITSPAAEPLQWGDWNVGATVRQAVQGLVGVVRFLVTLAIWVVALAPLWVPAVLLVRWWRRRRGRRRAAPPDAAG